jgi:hypothetical protein
MMENAIDFNLPSNEDDIKQTFINDSCDACTSYLKTRAGYVWESKRKQETLCVVTWSRKVLLRNIEKDGNAVDKENIPQTDGRRNAKHYENRKKRRKLATHEREERKRVRRRFPPFATPTPVILV